MDIERMLRLCEAFRRLPRMTASRQTVMELSGYPNWENVASNILAFYFSPGREHGFGSILLDSLVSLVQFRPDIGDLAVANVSREVSTSSKRRLDIVIRSDSAVVGIENKIYAPVYNDLQDYMEFLQSESRGHSILAVLLTLYEVPETVDLHRFKMVTYEQFFEAVFQRIPDRLSFIDSQYLAHFADFAATILRLRRGTQMDKQVLLFMKEHEQDVNELLVQAKAFRDGMKGKVDRLKDAIDIRSLLGTYEHSQYLYTQNDSLRCVLVTDLKISDNLRIIVDTALYPSGWRIELYAGKGTPRLQTWLRQHKIVVRPDTKWGEGHWLYDDSFSYDSDLGLVRDKLVELISQIQKVDSEGDT